MQIADYCKLLRLKNLSVDKDVGKCQFPKIIDGGNFDWCGWLGEQVFSVLKTWTLWS